MSDLVTWLRACIDEDEQAARDEEQWRIEHPPVPGVSYAIPPLMEHGWDDPARVLAEIAAKRVILDAYDQHEWWSSGSNEYVAGKDEAYAEVLRALVQPYAGRPGFDPSWAGKGTLSSEDYR